MRGMVCSDKLISDCQAEVDALDTVSSTLHRAEENLADRGTDWTDFL
jgi:hypothetical protein